MLSFKEKQALFRSYKELTEKPVSYERFNYHFESSRQRRKVVVGELSFTGNAYICGRYLTGYGGRVDARGWINIKDFSESEIIDLLGQALDSFK